MDFLRETLAAARLAFRLLWRRGWVAAGLALALLAGGVLPFSLSAAAPGRGLWLLRLLYGGGVSFAALSLFAVVAGVAAFARDAAAKILPGLLVTPARRWALVLGRHAALSLLLAALWALAGGLSFAAARAGAEGADGETDSAARFAYATVPFVRADGAGEGERGRFAADVLPAGATGRWKASAPAPERAAVARGADAILRVTAAGALEAGGELPVVLALGGEEARVTLHSGAECERPFSAAAETGSLAVSNESAWPAWFARETPPALRHPVASAAANALGGFALGAAHLALLAALGVALGALFHPAEALFFGLALLLAVGVSQVADGTAEQTREEFVEQVARFGGNAGHEPGKAARAAATAAYGAYRVSRAVLTPLSDAGDLARVAESEWIPPGEAARAVALQGFLIPALLTLAAAAGLAKREAFAE